MLNQPINVIPSVLSGVGEGVIDVADGLTVSWSVSGDTPMLAYQIVIQLNTTASTQKYTTGKVVLANPFYGTDSKGKMQTFTANKITASQLSSAGITNGYANGYKIIITQWWGATNTTSITQTSPSVFYTRATPTLDISINGDTPEDYTDINPYTSRSISFDGTFYQANGDTVSLARWILSEEDNTENPIVDTGDIETQLLQLNYDGLFSGTTYAVRLIVQTSSGVTVDTGFQDFYVEYAVSQDAGTVNVCHNSGQNYVQLNWSPLGIISGWTQSGNPTVSGGKLYLDEGDSVVFNEMNIPSPWSFAWRGSVGVSGGNTYDIVELTDNSNGLYKLSVSKSFVKFSYSGNIIFQRNFDAGYTAHSSDMFTIAVTPTKYYIRHETFTGGTIPAEDLYPSNSLYPSDVTAAVKQYSGDLSYSQTSITDIVFNGASVCEYFWMNEGEFSATTVQQLQNNSYYEPLANYQTLFLSTFIDNQLVAVVSSGGYSLGASIYRQENGIGALEHIVDVSGDYTVVRDYGVKSRTKYKYFIFEKGTQTYTSVFASDEITPYFNQYNLMECVYDDTDGAYHVQSTYPFYCNLTQGDISNNNTPSILNNFTQYPNRQPVSQLYKSGTLSALIGTVNQSEASYYDSWKLADEILELSTNTNPKFLRDTKGAIWKVETSSAITAKINGNNKFLPIQITIPWVEVGDANQCSIVALPTDPVYEKDQFYTTTLSVDPITGILTWTTPDNYNGTTISLSNSYLVAEVPTTIAGATIQLTNEGYIITNN